MSAVSQSPLPHAETVSGTGKVFPLVRVICGIVLLAAAALKAQGLALNPFSEDSFLASPRLQIATIEVEILLGLWLLSGLGQRAARLAALGFFAILATVSVYMVLEGQASCGCFGRIQVSPWLSFLVDIGLIAALARGSPELESKAATRAGLTTCLKTAGGAIAILTLLVAGLLVSADRPLDTLARLRGESVTVEPSVRRVGVGVRGESRTFTIQLRNITDHEIQMIGGTASCGCLATDDLPIVLAPGESRSMNVKMTFHGESGRFQHRFLLYTDDEVQFVVVGRFVGRVIERPN